MGSFVWTLDTLRPNLAVVPARVEKIIVGAIELNADRGLAFARKTAPWTDRTTNARNGLFTKTTHDPFKEHRIIISHSVPYGIWLEIRQQGKYAVIVPTLKKMGADTMKTIAKGLERLG